MIKPEMVPEAAFKAAHHKWLDPNSTWDEVVAAALNAWPGVNTDAVRCGTLILHLPKEPHNDEA